MALFVAIILWGCQFKSTLYLTGNHETIGAEVYIDNNFVGKMKGDNKGSLLIVKIEAGNHNLKVVGKNGRKFMRNFYIKGENYIFVEFVETDTTSVNND